MTPDTVRDELERRLGKRAVLDNVWRYLCGEGHVVQVLDDKQDLEWLADRAISFHDAAGSASSVLDKAAPVIPADTSRSLDQTTARSLLLAKEAEREPSVQRFRADVLGPRRLKPEELDQWIKERAKADGPATTYAEVALPRGTGVSFDEHGYVIEQSQLAAAGPAYLRALERPVAVHARTLSYAHGGSPWLRRIPTALGGTLDRLRSIAETIERRFEWPTGAGTAFILTGAAPIVRPIWSSTYSGRVRLDVDPALVRPRDIVAKYKALLQQIRRQRTRFLSEKHLRLAVFMADRERDPWRPWFDAWNAAYPQWKYDDESNFRRDATQARDRLLSDFSETQEQAGSPASAADSARRASSVSRSGSMVLSAPSVAPTKDSPSKEKPRRSPGPGQTRDRRKMRSVKSQHKQGNP
jgi:hypothetical protein